MNISLEIKKKYLGNSFGCVSIYDRLWNWYAENSLKTWFKNDLINARKRHWGNYLKLNKRK